jgi:hypothetical protein
MWVGYLKYAGERLIDDWNESRRLSCVQPHCLLHLLHHASHFAHGLRSKTNSSLHRW